MFFFGCFPRPKVDEPCLHRFFSLKSTGFSSRCSQVPLSGTKTYHSPWQRRAMATEKRQDGLLSDKDGRSWQHGMFWATLTVIVTNRWLKKSTKKLKVRCISWNQAIRDLSGGCNSPDDGPITILSYLPDFQQIFSFQERVAQVPKTTEVLGWLAL